MSTLAWGATPVLCSGPLGKFQETQIRGLHYAIRDPKAPTRFYAIGSLKKGVLDLDLRLVERDAAGREIARSNFIRGAEAFKDIMHVYGSQVQKIMGFWDMGHRDNLETFNELMGPPFFQSPEEAARNTFTGKMAVRAGYSVVHIDNEMSMYTEQAGIRHYTIVTVYFEKAR